MAEIAIGTVGVFQDCIYLISQIAAAKAFGRDYEILNTKLDIEKTLLLQWADNVSLFDSDVYSRRFNDETKQQVIKQALDSIRQLLSESTDLQQRYGVGSVQSNDSTEFSPPMSGRLMSRFSEQSALFKSQVKARNECVPLSRKVRWVVRDREKFNDLLNDLSYFINSLNTITGHITAQSTLQEELTFIQNIRNLQLIHRAAGEHENLKKATHKAVAEACTHKILDRLWFRKIDERQGMVAQAHSGTLAWSLYPPESDIAWDNLSEWLTSNSSIYWISGKAGSGKSTLMKYLFHHSAVKDLLRKWSNTRALTMANFFLWNLGRPEQKSQEGLARGLLFHVLNANRALVPSILPKMWRDAQNGGEVDLPSENEVREAFRKLGAEDTAGAYCFFIDGLDEYSGNYADGIRFIRELVQNPNVKIIVSSRPIHACVAAFSHEKKLFLQDLNRNDIDRYIADKVGSHSHIEDLMSMDPTATEALLLGLREKASGVFLWVILACRSLLDGFAAGDYVSELQRRIDELPPELEMLFRHILDKVDPRYRFQGARLLRICYERQLLQISSSMPTLALAMIDGIDMDIDKPPDFQELSIKEKVSKCRWVEGRLRSRTCGLLEVSRYMYWSHPHENAQNDEKIIDSTVEFLHRTVYEFLHDPEIWRLDCLQLGGERFNAAAILSCMSSYVLYFQGKDSLDLQDTTTDLATQNIQYARVVDKNSPDSIVPVCLHMGAVFLAKKQGGNPSMVTGTPSVMEPFFGTTVRPHRPEHAALLLAIEAGISSFIPKCRKFTRYASTRRSRPYPLLYHCFEYPFLRKIRSLRKYPSPDVISALISRGCDVNQRFTDENGNDTTPWERWLSICHKDKERRASKPAKICIAADISVAMLRAGADVRCIDPKSHSAFGGERFVSRVQSWLEYLGGLGEKDDYRRGIEVCTEILRLCGDW